MDDLSMYLMIGAIMASGIIISGKLDDVLELLREQNRLLRKQLDEKDER